MEIIAKVDNEGEEAFNARLYVQVHSLAFRYYLGLLDFIYRCFCRSHQESNISMLRAVLQPYRCFVQSPTLPTTRHSPATLGTLFQQTLRWVRRVRVKRMRKHFRYHIFHECHVFPMSWITWLLNMREDCRKLQFKTCPQLIMPATEGLCEFAW